MDEKKIDIVETVNLTSKEEQEGKIKVMNGKVIFLEKSNSLG